MNLSTLKLFALSLILMTGVSCTGTDDQAGHTGKRYQFPCILDISVTPEHDMKRVGCFTDEGSWMGFTIPEEEKWINGFCGPFSIDNRIWFAQSAVSINLKDNQSGLTPDSISYFPGEVYISSRTDAGSVEQRMIFASANTAFLSITNNTGKVLSVSGKGWNKDITLTKSNPNVVTAHHPNGETVQITFPQDVLISCQDNNYTAEYKNSHKETYIAISFYTSDKDLMSGEQRVTALLNNPEQAIYENNERWERYLSKIIRNDMKPEYNRIAAKSIVTLISNWRTHREGLLHDGVIPSHAVSYFIGFWAWDSWRFSAALARFEPELAKNNIRAMFDYQLADGMVIDCIYTDPKENNARDSKPPLACWAVDEIFRFNNDTAFVKEMYPQLLSYYKWWYQKRDNNQNGMCEFGCTDGTLEAAGWESGMDNAIRFDNCSLLKNADDAWSFNQESVDLNAYLAYECKLLKKFAQVTGNKFDGPDFSDKVADYFFNEEMGFFCDRKLPDGKFVQEAACEGYTPFWTGIASQQQMDRALVLLTDTAKFSTYIPFPTAAADNPKCSPDGYWRGPIWLDQTYQAIKGLRNYGYTGLADKYTMQVFDRCEGLTGTSPIHENYGTHDGKCLQAPHFSWSASHLLMLYEDFGK